jgi:hypothetical protein
MQAAGLQIADTQRIGDSVARSDITIDLPTIVMNVRMPRLYGLRLRIVGLCMLVASWVAGSAIVIDVEHEE